MEKQLVLHIIGLGGGLFIFLIVFWFIGRHLRRRSSPDPSTRMYIPPADLSWEDRRRHPRIAVSWRAVIETADRTEEVRLKDISLGGAFIVCPEPLALNAKFKIDIVVPNRAPLGLNAEVVWSNRNMAGDRVVNRGMGVRFIENSEEDRQRLKEDLTTVVEAGLKSR